MKEINLKIPESMLKAENMAYDNTESGLEATTTQEAIDEVNEKQETHEDNTENPHKVTAKQIGLDKVPNVSTNDQTPTFTEASSLTQLTSGEKLTISLGKIAKAVSSLISHLANTSNPHGVTKAQVGLGNAENKSSATIRGEITKSNVTNALGYTPLDSSLKGAANGVAELDSTGKVPSSQLPGYVDDVLEYSAKSSFPTTGESGKIYVDTSTNKTYRWSGTAYTEISASLALGETSSTAYRGDRGKVAYDHSQSTHGIAQGGTGATTAKGAQYNLLNDMNETTASVDDNSLLVFKYTSASSSGGAVLSKKASLLWEYIKGKISSILGLTASSYGGNSATATKATKDGKGQQIDSTYIKGMSVSGKVITYTRGDDTTGTITTQDTNTTYTNASLGQGYGTCATAAATTAKVVTLSNYALSAGGVVSVKFTYAVPASATMNINSKGAKSIYYKGAAIKAGVINAGDVAVFIYDGTRYHLLAVDSLFQSVSDGKALVASAITGKGVTTATDATFETMAANIGKIIIGGGTGSKYLRYENGYVQAQDINGNWQNIFQTNALPLELLPGTHLDATLNYLEYYSGSYHDGYLNPSNITTGYGSIATIDEAFEHVNNDFICKIGAIFTITLKYYKSHGNTTNKSIVYLNGEELLKAENYSNTEAITKSTTVTLKQGDKLSLYAYSASWCSAYAQLVVTT